MNPKAATRYIETLLKYKTDIRLDRTSLGFLGHFAWKKSVSSYQIYSDIKSTVAKMAYKNVYKRVNALFSLGLIEQVDTNPVENNKHKARYFRLTEYGIYRLFLNNLRSVFVNQSNLGSNKDLPSKIPSNVSAFFQNYSNCSLFEVFLYPYFEKDTISATRDLLLWDLYEYLSDCCRLIEKKLIWFQMRNIPINEVIFSWNKIPGDNDELLLSHLAHLFNLEEIESNSGIEKITMDGDLPAIKVSTNSAPIIIKLDQRKNEVIVMSNVGNAGYQEKVYGVQHINNEMVVVNKIPQEDYLRPLIEEAERQIQQLIYKFVSDLASSPMDSESSYRYNVLSRDEKFMKVAKEIYEKRHRSFERGYKLLKKIG
jgi:hypothetical protein